MNKQPPSIDPDRLHRVLRRLLDIYSPSGKEEEILDFVHHYLTSEGLPVRSQEVEGPRRNLLVIPPENRTELVLLGHLDTVAAYDLDHYGYREKNGLVYGLGAADMKSGCAAMMEAYREMWQSGRSKIPVALALVVGEEEEGDGAQKLAKEYHFPWVLIGEPTDLKPCLSHYGYLEAQITTRGKRMHASLANRGLNPVETMLRLLLKVTHYLETERREIVYNIRDLSSSQSGFAVPDRCDAWLDLHLPPTASIGEITLEVEQILLQENLKNPFLNGSLRFTTIHTGYELPEQWPMVTTLKKVLANQGFGWKPQAFRSHSDANILWAAGMKPFLLGCGQLEKAHAPDESVSFDQVLAAAEIYLGLLLELSS